MRSTLFRIGGRLSGLSEGGGTSSPVASVPQRVPVDRPRESAQAGRRVTEAFGHPGTVARDYGADVLLQVLGQLGVGAFFLAMAWWHRTHEHWSAANDRASWDQHPSRWTEANHRMSVLATRVLAPLGLVALGVVSVVQGITAILG